MKAAAPGKAADDDEWGWAADVKPARPAPMPAEDKPARAAPARKATDSPGYSSALAAKPSPATRTPKLGGSKLGASKGGTWGADAAVMEAPRSGGNAVERPHAEEGFGGERGGAEKSKSALDSWDADEWGDEWTRGGRAGRSPAAPAGGGGE